MTGNYRCTRCGMDEHQAREARCAKSPCPMELIANQLLTLKAGTVVLIRGIPMRLVEDALVESHRNNFRAAGH
jgi:hypothetical protein